MLKGNGPAAELPADLLDAAAQPGAAVAELGADGQVQGADLQLHDNSREGDRPAAGAEGRVLVQERAGGEQDVPELHCAGVEARDHEDDREEDHLLLPAHQDAPLHADQDDPQRELKGVPPVSAR